MVADPDHVPRFEELRWHLLSGHDTPGKVAAIVLYLGDAQAPGPVYGHRGKNRADLGGDLPGPAPPGHHWRRQDGQRVTSLQGCDLRC